MPSQKPRIALTVDDDMNELLTEIATLQGIPKSTLIVQYLDALRPHIVEIREALRLVRQQKDATPHLRKMLLDGQQDLFDTIRKEFTDD